jgi:hypothetical protein
MADQPLLPFSKPTPTPTVAQPAAEACSAEDAAAAREAPETPPLAATAGGALSMLPLPASRFSTPMTGGPAGLSLTATGLRGAYNDRFALPPPPPPSFTPQEGKATAPSSPVRPASRSPSSSSASSSGSVRSTPSSTRRMSRRTAFQGQHHQHGGASDDAADGDNSSPSHSHKATSSPPRTMSQIWEQVLITGRREEAESAPAAVPSLPLLVRRESTSEVEDVVIASEAAAISTSPPPPSGEEKEAVGVATPPSAEPAPALASSAPGPLSARSPARPAGSSVFLYQSLGPQNSPQLIPALLAATGHSSSRVSSRVGTPARATAQNGESPPQSGRRLPGGLSVIASVPGLAASLLAATFVEAMGPSSARASPARGRMPAVATPPRPASSEDVKDGNKDYI